MMLTWRLWQLADSAFPTGGFAHSGGLEAALQQGEVRDRAGFENFLNESLWQAGQAALPLASSAYDAPESWDELDRICDSFLTGHVANRASRVQGRTFLATCLRSIETPELKRLGESVKGRPTVQHFAPLFGVTLKALGVPKDFMQRLFVYLAMRGVISSAIRLGIFGPYQAQKIQWELAPRLNEILLHCGDLQAKDLAQTAPLLEILQSNHDRLYSRLFQS